MHLYPRVRIVLSGSAAHSIFKKSLEILLGRVTSESLTPFSFREYFQCNLSGTLTNQKVLHGIQTEFERDLSPSELFSKLKKYTSQFKDIRMQDHLQSFLNEGGFPQLWLIPEKNVIEKAHNIDENYVRKVTLEDLMLLRKIKKPELFKRLLRHLFARPGQEYNQVKVASDLETTAVTLADAMDLLSQTDLLLFVEKFSTKAESLKRKNIKVYPVDLTLTFAMTKIVPSLEDNNQKGFVAESLVAQILFRLRGASKIAFMQTQNALRYGEVDFFVRSETKDCPIEVKYQTQISPQDIDFLERIIIENKLEGGIIVTPNYWGQTRAVSFIPLWAFALLS